jgi:hypothetical protein
MTRRDDSARLFTRLPDAVVARCLEIEAGTAQ